MKKLLIIAAAVIMAALPLSGAYLGVTDIARAESNVLRIYNWEEYIHEDLVDEFIEWHAQEYGEQIEVIYSNYGTNEILYNELKINKGTYDLICPSDYMMEKLIDEGMLEKIDGTIENYQTYASGYIKGLFETYGWDEYAIGYMWGTLGYIYNSDFIDPADAETWVAVWNVSYNNQTTLKDSIRDTYFMGVAYVYRSELNGLADDLRDGILSSKEYNDALTQIFNRTDTDTVNKVEQALLAAKKNIFSFELDDGKKDMVSGKINLNFAWSGDAIWAMNDAEEDGVELSYSVPKEGSNIWFDGWVMPKGANKRLAQRFLEYISMPEQAVKNMEEICYTSVIAGDEVWEDYVKANYEDAEGEYEVDLSYFFDNLTDGDAVITVSTLGRQFSAQYPDEDTINRSVIMRNFDDEELSRIDSMWQKVKGTTLPMGVIILIVVIVVAAVAVTVTIILLKKRGIFSKKKGWSEVKRG